MSLLAELMSVDVLNLIGLLAVVFIGLPHGAMDGALAIHLGWMNRPIKAATFLLAYVGLAALVVGMWLVVPTVGFLVFLAISLFHFGRGDIVPRAKEHQLAEVLMRGGLVLAGISLFHRSEVDSIFEVLIGSDTEIVWLFLQAVGVLTIVLIPYVIFSKSKQERASASVEVIGLLALFAIAPPLLGICDLFLRRTFCTSLQAHGYDAQVNPATIPSHSHNGGLLIDDVGSWVVGVSKSICIHRTRACTAASHLHRSCCPNGTTHDPR